MMLNDVKWCEQAKSEAIRFLQPWVPCWKLVPELAKLIWKSLTLYLLKNIVALVVRVRVHPFFTLYSAGGGTHSAIDKWSQ